MFLLGDELSAEPLQLFAARVADLQPAAVARALEAYGQPDRGFDVRAERAELCRLAACGRPLGAVRPHPVLRLPDGEPATEHDFESVLLCGGALEPDQRSRLPGADRT